MEARNESRTLPPLLTKVRARAYAAGVAGEGGGAKHMRDALQRGERVESVGRDGKEAIAAESDGGTLRAASANRLLNTLS